MDQIFEAVEEYRMGVNHMELNKDWLIPVCLAPSQHLPQSFHSFQVYTLTELELVDSTEWAHDQSLCFKY